MAYDYAKTRILHDPAMIQIYKKADMLTTNQASVLISGETGVGKHYLASYIQKNSFLASGPFITINCNALSDYLFASELFGYVPNAFTGASPKGKIGLLEAANHGTVLFNEINELSAPNQTLLLHFLQNRNITPIGSLKPRDITTRILCTSSHSLTKMIAEGTFRSDLYYRIRVADIFIPPLRERKSEIPLFLRHFLAYYRDCFQCPETLPEISEEQATQLCELNWDGNIQEIANLSQQICLSNETPNTVINAYIKKKRAQQTDSLPTTFTGQIHMSVPAVSPAPPESRMRPLKEALREFEQSYIQQALDQTNSLREAADLLGISFSSLCRKKADYQLNRHKRVKHSGLSN